MGLLRWIAVLAVGCAACGGTPTCKDSDADGFGAHCKAGPDCDDTNPLRVANCDFVDPPDCEADPFSTGCPCLAGSVASCYSGAEGTEDVGVCQGGVAYCVNLYWGICRREVPPTQELCEGTRDEDCDGAVDEGVTSPCGGCDNRCLGDVWGDAPSLFKESDGEGVAVNALRELVLVREAPAIPTNLWALNTAAATVSRIDTDLGAEVARYASGAPFPSRVAVDYVGDAWIANRADNDQSTVIKIAGDPSRCVDADMNGVTTSSGPLDVLAVGADECVVRSVPVGAAGDMARAVVVDGDFGEGVDDAGGNVWVGLYAGEAVVKLDGATGDVLQTVDLPGFHPAAGAFDPWGVLWLLDRNGYLARINRRSDPADVAIVEVPFACYLLEDIGVDSLGRLFLSGGSCNTALRYEPRDGSWLRITVPESPRGVLVGDDTVWMSHTAGYVTSIALPAFTVTETVDLTLNGMVPLASLGMGRDESGALWTVSGSLGGGDALGVVTKMTTTDGPVAAVGIGLGPETQGDLTGAVLPGGFDDGGVASHVFGHCEVGKTEWQNLHVESDPGATGSILVEARHADSKAKLGDADFEVLGTLPNDPSPFALDFDDDGVVEVRLTLHTTARDGSPRVRRVGLEWRCDGGPG